MVGHVTQSEHMCAILIDHVFKKDNEMRKKQQEEYEQRKQERQEQEGKQQEDRELRKQERKELEQKHKVIETCGNKNGRNRRGNSKRNEICDDRSNS